MKITAIIVLALALMGCDLVPGVPAMVIDIGEFPLFSDESITVSQGEYQAGIEVFGIGSVTFTASGGLMVNGKTTHTVNEPGEYWLIISTGTMNPGDVGTIESKRTAGVYYSDRPQEYDTFVLEIEVEL